MSGKPHPAVVIGAGPNGLMAAIELARAGLPTTLYEEQPTVGGGARTAALTLPGFVHDVCSAVVPLAAASPAFASLPLAGYGLDWLRPPVELAHPFDDGTAILLHRGFDLTCAGLGEDGPPYRRVMAPFVIRWADLLRNIMQPILHVPSAPLLAAQFGRHALPSAITEARRVFKTERGQALFAGLAAHSILPLEQLGTAAVGWLLAAAAHAVGWPMVEGGTQGLADALAAHFTSIGGRIETGVAVRSLAQIGAGPDTLVLCDLTPRQFLDLAGHQVPGSFVGRLASWRYGPGVFKVDYALNAPIPWRAQECARAGTVHLGGMLPEIAASERAAWRGELAERPFVLLAQPSLFDKSRAPAGRHTAWAYCHVPNGSTADRTAAIEAQIERFAPGFARCVIARHSTGPAAFERHNANLIGGDITGGAQTLWQMLFRPTASLYSTPLAGVYLCGASTPPGAGVHGMCGYLAARRALHDMRHPLTQNDPLSDLEA